MWQTKDEIKCKNVKWNVWWYGKDFKCIIKLTSLNSIEINLMSVAYLEFHKGENFRWPLVLSAHTEKEQTMVSYFFLWWNINFTKRSHSSIPPPNTPLIRVRSFRSHCGNQQILTSWADERIKDETYKINTSNEWHRPDQSSKRSIR